MKVLPPRNPVLLVHGIWDTGRIFQVLSNYLRRLGWLVYDLDLEPNNGDAKLEMLAQQVAGFVDRTFDLTTPIDLVGFSMGGIVSRYYVQRLGGRDRVQRLITVSAPHHGTWVSYGSQRPGCIQMRPNSPFLQDLNRDVETLAQLNLTSIWTPFDAMIVPANSSVLSIGRNVKVPVAVHAWMVRDLRSLQAIAAALSEPIADFSPIAATENCL
jgi:triacylglycerol lipase